jgi:hypothetical protein
MSTTAQPRRFRWLRSRLGRRLAIGISVGLIALVGVAIWRTWTADELPDIGDPFDVAEALRPIDLPDDQNAYAVYATIPSSRTPFWKAFPNVDFKTLTWSKAGPELRAFVEQERSAMEKWREGSERPDALYQQPGETAKNQGVPQLTQNMANLARLGAMEGSRLEEAGAMSQAWDWYQAMLRFSRLVGRHGGWRYVGARLHDLASSRILRWAADARVDAGQLRKALDDTLAADALTPPFSEAIKLEYLGLSGSDGRQVLRDFGIPLPALPGGEHGPMQQMAALVGAEGSARVAWILANNNVERSRPAIRLLYANWLAQIDRPASQRAPVAIEDPVLIYAVDPAAPVAARAVAPERLARAIERNPYARAILFVDDAHHHPFRPPQWEGNGLLARERRRRSALIVRLAAELYRREHGAAPATAGALVDRYLKELPEAIAPGDPIPTGIE